MEFVFVAANEKIGTKEILEAAASGVAALLEAGRLEEVEKEEVK